MTAQGIEIKPRAGGLTFVGFLRSTPLLGIALAITQCLLSLPVAFTYVYLSYTFYGWWLGPTGSIRVDILGIRWNLDLGGKVLLWQYTDAGALAATALSFLVYHFYYQEAGEEGAQVVIWIVTELYRTTINALLSYGYAGRWTAERRVYTAADLVISHMTGKALAGGLLLAWHYYSLVVPVAIIVVAILELCLTMSHLGTEDFVVMIGGAITGVALMAVDLLSLTLGLVVEFGGP